VNTRIVAKFKGQIRFLFRSTGKRDWAQTEKKWAAATANMFATTEVAARYYHKKSTN